MKVVKFGGTSVGSARGLKCLKEIIEGSSEPVIVVVSALGGVTDQLLSMSRMAAEGDAAGYQTEYTKMRERHLTAVKESVIPEHKQEVCEHLTPLLDELGNILKGVSLIGESSPKTTATIVSYGERLSSEIVARVLEQAVLLDAREIIKTQPYFGIGGAHV